MFYILSLRENDTKKYYHEDFKEWHEPSTTTKKLQFLGTNNKSQKPKLKVGIILPNSIYKKRDYNRVSLSNQHN